MSDRAQELIAVVRSGTPIVAIHYSCENLVELSGRSAIVGSIVVERVDTEDVRLFSRSSGDDGDAEFGLLDGFFRYASEHEAAAWVHWNMATAKFGFAALVKRFEELGGQAPDPWPPDMTFGLSQIFEELRGSPITEHPKLFVAAGLNQMLPHRALLGVEEAEHLEIGDFAALDLSTEEKVKWIARMTRRFVHGQLVVTAQPLDAARLWSSLREPLTALTFTKMKEAAGAAGLPTVELAHLTQGQPSATSKGTLADAIDGLFNGESDDQQLAIAERMIAEIRDRTTDESLRRKLRELRLSAYASRGARPPQPLVEDEGPVPATPPRESGPVFVSHASDNQEVADLFVKEVLRLGLSISSTEIVYTSGANTGPPGSAAWFTWLEANLRGARVVIAIATDEYMESPLCLMELGAAWVAEKLLILSLPRQSSVINALQYFDAVQTQHLDALGQELAERLGVELDLVNWSSGKDTFHRAVLDLRTGD